ncbi:MAG: hypothetical protein WB662_04990 [Methyloceanibacter sp.]
MDHAFAEARLRQLVKLVDSREVLRKPRRLEFRVNVSQIISPDWRVGADAAREEKAAATSD